MRRHEQTDDSAEHFTNHYHVPTRKDGRALPGHGHGCRAHARETAWSAPPSSRESSIGPTKHRTAHDCVRVALEDDARDDVAHLGSATMASGRGRGLSMTLPAWMRNGPAAGGDAVRWSRSSHGPLVPCGGRSIRNGLTSLLAACTYRRRPWRVSGQASRGQRPKCCCCSPCSCSTGSGARALDGAASLHHDDGGRHGDCRGRWRARSRNDGVWARSRSRFHRRHANGSTRFSSVCSATHASSSYCGCYTSCCCCCDADVDADGRTYLKRVVGAQD